MSEYNRQGTSLVVQWLRLHLPMQGVRDHSLVRELRSHMPHRQKAKKYKQKQYCNKFNRDFKMVHIKKKILKKYTYIIDRFFGYKNGNVIMQILFFGWTRCSIQG